MLAGSSNCRPFAAASSALRPVECRQINRTSYAALPVCGPVPRISWAALGCRPVVLPTRPSRWSVEKCNKIKVKAKPIGEGWRRVVVVVVVARNNTKLSTCCSAVFGAAGRAGADALLCPCIARAPCSGLALLKTKCMLPAYAHRLLSFAAGLRGGSEYVLSIIGPFLCTVFRAR